MLNWIVNKLDRVRTAYRRIEHPEIRRGDLVIDIGCGGLPNPRANVACDSFEDNLERDTALKVDRPFVWADAERLPFRERAFDYSILSHVLEHLTKPAESLTEIQRISKAGYIETPNAFYEFVIPHTYHVSRCTLIDGRMVITFKTRWDDTLSDPAYADVLHDMKKTWFALHHLDARSHMTRYRWRDRIDFEVRGTHIPFEKSEELMKAHSSIQVRSWLRKTATWLVYQILRPRRAVDLHSILACPLCKGSLRFSTAPASAHCAACNRTYSQHRGHYDFRIPATVPAKTGAQASTSRAEVPRAQL